MGRIGGPRPLGAALVVCVVAFATFVFERADPGVRPGHTEAAERAARHHAARGGADPARILLLGDSITQGGREPGRPRVESYRPRLFRALVDHGARFDFVGSMRMGLNDPIETPPYRGRAFDPDHEGHWGWTSRRIRRRLDGWLARYDADVALVLLGSNDRDHGLTVGDTVDELGRVVDALRRDNPRVVVLLGQVFHEGLRYQHLRWRTAALAEATSTRASPVLAVDHRRGWSDAADPRRALTIDGVHPNAAGDARLAESWMSALGPFVAPRVRRARAASIRGAPVLAHPAPLR